MLLVLASIGVYAGTAALCLCLAHRFVQPIGRGAAFALAAAPLLFTGRAMVTGGVCAPIDILYDSEPFAARRAGLGIGSDRNPILSDVVFQEIPWRKAVREAVKRGDLPLWNPHILAGEPLLAVQQPAVLHPGTWLGFLLPLPQAWTFEMSLRLLLALLSAYLFLRDLWCGELAALLGSFGWAFSNYLVFYLGYPLTPAAAPFPLLLLGLRRIAREPGWRSVGITVTALLLVVTSGHPETVLHGAAGAGLYFLFELVRTARGRRLRPLLTALGAGALALALSAVLLLPLAEALPQTLEQFGRTSWYAHQPRAAPASEIGERLASQAAPYVVGVSARGLLPKPGFYEPTAYAGSLLFPFAVTGLFGRRRERWFFAGLAILAVSVAIRTPAADALAKLPLFDIAVNERLLFVAAFSVCALAAFGAQRLRDGEGLPAFIGGTVVTALGTLWIYARFSGDMAAVGLSAAARRERFLPQVVPLVVAAAVFASLPRIRRAKAGLAAVVLIFAVQRTIEVGGSYPTLPSRVFYPDLPVLSKIPREEPYRFAGVAWTLIPNAAALYGLEDVRGYEAMTYLPYWQTYPLWCVHQPVWFNRVDDPARPFLAFLNVRWVIAPVGVAPPAGWPVLAEGDGVRLLENPRVLPRAFAPGWVRSEPDGQRRLALLADIADFGQRGVFSEAGRPAGEWVSNGEAHVAIAAYAARSVTIDVVARDETVVATSIPAWTGWKARVDGRRVVPLPYNHAFLGFRIPAGRHRLELRYRPDGFVIGAAISLVTLAALALRAWMHRRSARVPVLTSADRP